jgi:hypothetical protein
MAMPGQRRDGMKEGIRKHLTTVVVAFVTAAIAAGGTAAAAALINADRLNGYPANGLTRVSASSKDNNSVIGDGSDHIIRKVSIKAPKAGYLVVVASTDGYLSTGTQAYADCWIELDGTQLDSSVRSADYYNSGATENTESDCVTNIAWSVKAGKHAVRFVGDPQTGVIFDESALTVQYVPFNGAGAVPKPVKPTTSGRVAGN